MVSISSESLYKPVIRAALTQEMVNDEVRLGIFKSKSQPDLHCLSCYDTNEEGNVYLVVCTNRYSHYKNRLNFRKDPIAAKYCVNTITTGLDRQGNRDRV